MDKVIAFVETLIEEKISDKDLFLYAFRYDQQKKIEYERLEYLGDAVLELVISDFLFRKYPDKAEGLLTSMRSKIANRKFLNDTAIKLAIDTVVVQEKNGNAVKHMYGSVLEAFTGALFLDFGFEKAKNLVLTKIVFPFVCFEDFDNQVENFKGTLLEYFQKRKKKIEFITYKTESSEGKLFESRIIIDGVMKNFVEIASSKKEAEQKLSKKILDSIFVKNVVNTA